jgi:hypothetical protein
MSSLPENINFGNPNAQPTNFPSFDNLNMQTNSTNEKNKESTEKSKELNDKIINFLNLKTISILTIAIAIAIGLGIKDFINSFVMSVLQPSLMLLIMTIDKNDYLPFTSSLREKNPQANLDISKLLGSLLVLKLIVGTTYLFYVYTNILSPLKLI